MKFTSVKQTLSTLESNSQGSEIAVRIINEDGTWYLYGSNVFDSSTTLQDVITYLASNNVKTDKVVISTNSNNNAFNNSLPVTTGALVEVIPNSKAKAYGSWDRGYVKVTNIRNGDTYIAGILDRTITSFKQVGMYSGIVPNLTDNLNTPLTVGSAMFTVNRHLNNTTNAPTTGSGIVLSWSSSDQYGAQIEFNNNGLYYRKNDAGTISSWQKLST